MLAGGWLNLPDHPAGFARQAKEAADGLTNSPHKSQFGKGTVS